MCQFKFLTILWSILNLFATLVLSGKGSMKGIGCFQAPCKCLSCFPSCPLQDPAAEARMKVACITEQVLTLVNKRLGLYRHFDEAVNKYKQSRDISTLNSGKKTLETEHKVLTSEIASLQSKLKTEGSDLCDKVRAFACLICALRGFVYYLRCPHTLGLAAAPYVLS